MSAHCGLMLAARITLRVLINPVCKRGSLNVRFAPKATELLRRREMTRWARCGPTLDATHRHYAAPNGTPSSVMRCIRRRFALVIV